MKESHIKLTRGNVSVPTVNGHTYRTDDFVYVANDNSIKAQEAARRDKNRGLLPQLTQH